MILNGRLSRQARHAFQFGRTSALKASSNALEQLQERVVVLQGQLAVERACVTELQAQVEALLQQLDTARAELVDRNLLLRLVGTSCSATVH